MALVRVWYWSLLALSSLSSTQTGFDITDSIINKYETKHQLLLMILSRRRIGHLTLNGHCGGMSELSLKAPVQSTEQSLT
ncbi:hypothetical protein V8F33_001316 [Rhypophila sp. PSN 637]